MRARAVYFGAWAVFGALNVLPYMVTGLLPVRQALLTSLLTVLPQALLGLVAVRFCRRFRFPATARVRFFAAHLLAGLVYGIACATASNALFAAHRWLVEGVFRPYFLEAGIVAWQVLMAALLYAIVASLAYAGELLQRLRAEEARAARAAVLQSEAELRALRAQLQPHFLFNTLHTLLSLVRSGDGRAAEEALEQFGELMHYAVRGGDEVRLASEIEFVRNYLALERLRLGERLRIEEDVAPETLALVIPVFSLQPLVENAVRHGIAPRRSGGTLRIFADICDGMLRLSVGDDGPGEPAEGAGNGLGLRLVRERLETLYGTTARMSVRSESGKGFQVTLEIPARHEGVGAP